MKRNVQINNSKHLSYLDESTLLDHMDELIEIDKKIQDELCDYPNFNGIDFTDVHAGGIQIRGHHVKVNGYSYGDQITLEYDFSNKDDAIEQFVKCWKVSDTPDRLRGFQRFIEDGKKYGWD